MNTSTIQINRANEEVKGPKAKFSAGQIQVAIWENIDKEGNLRQSVSITKRYKSGEEWKSTNSMNLNDLPKAIVALQKAYEFMALKEQT